MHDGSSIFYTINYKSFSIFSNFRFNVDLSVYPLMTAIEERLNQLPAFKQAHPNQQPDCPSEQ